MDVPIPFDELSCEIEQIGPHISILFSCYASHGSSRCAKFFMWDVSSQEQVAVGSFQATIWHLLISFVVSERDLFRLSILRIP